MLATHRHALDAYRAALYDVDIKRLRHVVADCFDARATLQLAWPFETLEDTDALVDGVLAELAAAWPDLERRDSILMRGQSEAGLDWLGMGGHYLGRFMNPWLGIPPTGKPVAMRFHEFFRIEDGQVVEMQALWDLPEVMLQAGVWPLVPSLGREWQVPGPATQDGLTGSRRDEARSASSLALVHAMLTGLEQHATGGVEAMQLDSYWHPHFNWYGPSGIGSTRGIDGFRHAHQIPFLNAMPDRRGCPDEGHLFGDNDYVGFTGWPGMQMTLSDAGWLGIPPLGKAITMRSLDFWRCERGRIRENWVLVDLLSVYDQIGVDVLARMRERVGY